jgi:hypothetical protein
MTLQIAFSILMVLWLWRGIDNATPRAGEMLDIKAIAWAAVPFLAVLTLGIAMFGWPCVK